MFGSNNEFTTVPSTITYSSGRSGTRVTIRESQASFDLNTMPIITSELDGNDFKIIPILELPLGFTPVSPNSDRVLPSSNRASYATTIRDLVDSILRAN